MINNTANFVIDTTKSWKEYKSILVVKKKK